MNTKKIILLLQFSILCTIGAFAQIKMPQASPPSKVAQMAGLTQFNLEYSRPSMKGRKIFGDLVPFGAVWRTGANAASTLEFDTEVMVEGQKVDPGKYAIYTIPEKNEWTVVLSKNTELWGSIGYSKEDDVVRVKVPSKKLKDPLETFEIRFTDISDTGVTIALAWEKTKAEVRLETEVDPSVMRQIKAQVIDGTPANTGLYFQAATYYFNNEKDLKQALEWATKVVVEDEKYWNVHLKAKIEQKLGMKEEAKKSAMRSMALAKQEKNPDYITLNEKLLKSIK
ncbi:DUF2911 domain-containing protein [Pleomorphovibrio marinus]|uniref:DUF2911 domain-containing protein n=1 Tax=Pleomorphovibrio marinus TaxID=2164132 RepID=UPI000E0A4D3B|nr:DUF2911 domain-containing protein [Pleomorphovibrio marinus]